MNIAILKTAISPSEITASIDQAAGDKLAIDEIFVVHKDSSGILGLVLNARHNTSNTGEISFVVSLIDSTTKQLCYRPNMTGDPASIAGVTRSLP